MNILEIARKCNADLTTFDGEPLAYTFAIENLYKFSDLVILQHFIDNENQQEITTLTNENKQLQLDNKEMSERLIQCEKLAQSVMLDIGDRNEDR